MHRPMSGILKGEGNKLMTEKNFDCVEMKRAAGLRIHEELKGKSREEQLAYW